MQTVKYMNEKTGRVELVKCTNSGNVTVSSDGFLKHFRANSKSNKPTVAQADAHAKHNGYIRIGTRKNKGRRNDYNT